MSVTQELFSRHRAEVAVQKDGQGTRLCDNNTYENDRIQIFERLQPKNQWYYIALLVYRKFSKLSRTASKLKLFSDI